MTGLTPEQLLVEAALRLRDVRRETMTPSDDAIFDMMVMIELYKRGAVQDLYLEMRLLADKHLRAAPYIAGILKVFSAHIKPDSANIVAFTKPQPGGKPCP